MDIDNLSIEISASVSSAISALENLSSALTALNTQLDRINPNKLQGVASTANEVSDSFSGLGESAKSVEQVASSLERVGEQVGEVAQLGSASEGAAQAMNDLSRESQEAGRSIEEAGQKASSCSGKFGSIVSWVKNLSFSFADLKAIGGTIGAVLNGLGTVSQNIFKSLANHAKKASKSMHEFSLSSNIATNTAKKLAKELTRVSKMLKLMVTRMALRAVIKEIGNGFKSLALHSEEFNSSVSSLINGSKKLGYSFSAMVAPLINALAPALVYIINLLTKLANVIQQVFASLTGSNSWNKAKDFTTNWADDIKAANKQAKDLKKTVLGFDELNQMQDNKNSGGSTAGNIEDMFETLPVDDMWKKVADTIKKYANKLFDPIKKAWAKVGDFVKKSWKYALNEVLKLGKSIARDFWKVWEQEKTQKIFENILKIIGWIGQAVGNLAKRFREAWDKNDTGLHILENIRDIVLIITEHLESMAKATAEWADSLDFSPALEKFSEWLESLEPVVDNLVGIFEDFYTEALLPLGKWAIEEGTPKLLQVFIDFNNKVDWEGLRTNLKELWKHLEPFAETVGEGLIMFIDKLANALADGLNSQEFKDFLTKIEEWMDNVTPQDVADGLDAIAKAIVGFAIGKTVIDGLVAISGFLKLVSSLAPLLKLTISIAIVYGAFKLGGLIGKWLTGDPVYDEYPLTVQLKWAVDEFPKSWSDFKDKAKEWADAWHSMLTEADGFIRGLANTVDAIFNPIGHGIRQIAGFGIEDISGNGGAGANIEADEWQKTTEAAREATEQAQKYQDAKHGSGGRGDSSQYNPEIDAWNNVSDAVSKVSETTKTATENARNFRAGVENLTEKQKSLKGILSQTSQETGNFKTKSDNLSSTLKTNKTDTENLNAVLKNANDAYKNVKIGMEEPVKYAPIVTQAQKGIEDSIKGLGTESQKFSTDEKVVWQAFATDTAQAGVGFAGTAHEITKTMDETTTDIEKQTSTISKAFSKDKWMFSGVVDGLKKTFEDALGAVKNLWNKFADKLNGEHEIGGGKFNINLPKFANGGFPENGLFLANSTEMVGRFSNGKTAVANNAQIVEGISAGVYSAVSSALANSGGNKSGGYIANTIVLDGEVIARTISKAQERQNMRYSPQMG